MHGNGLKLILYVIIIIVHFLSGCSGIHCGQLRLLSVHVTINSSAV